MGALSAKLNAEEKVIGDSPIKPLLLAVLIKQIGNGVISNNIAKQLFDELWTPSKYPGLFGSSYDEITVSFNSLIELRGLKQESDSGAIEAIIEEVLAANPVMMEEFKAGKEKAFNALVGQVMKASKGKANPAQVNELLRKKLS